MDTKWSQSVNLKGGFKWNYFLNDQQYYKLDAIVAISIAIEWEWLKFWGDIVNT